MVKASYKSYSIIINLTYLSIIFVFLRNTHHSSILLTHKLIILGDQTMWVSPSLSPSCGLLGLWGLGISTLRQPVSQLPLCHAAAMPLASLGEFFFGRNAAGLVISLGFHLIYIFFQEAQWSFALRPISCSMNSKNKIRPAIFVGSQLQCPHHMQWHACVCMCLRNLLVVQLLHWWPVGHKWPEKEHELLLCTSLADTPSTQPCSSCQIGPCQS